MANFWAALDACVSFADQFAERIPAGGVERFLFDAIWQSTLIGSATCGLLLLVRHRASHRAALAWLGLMLSMAVPLGTAAVRAGNWGQRPAIVARTIENVPPLILPSENATLIAAMDVLPPIPSLDSELLSTEALPSHDEPSEVAILEFPPDDALPPAPIDEPEVSANVFTFSRLFLAGWGVLSLACLWRLVRSYLLLARLKHRAQPCADAEIQAAVLRAARAVGLRHVPEIACSTAVESPAIVAWGRGLLLLPVERPSGTDIYAVACHELAHLRRGDGWSRMTVEIATALMPWQFLVWRLRAEFRRACEEACDDWVVAMGTDPVELASTLANWLRPTPASAALGMSESVSVTRRRILRLLAQQKPPQPRLGRVWLATGLALALSSGAALAFWQAPQPIDQPSEPLAKAEAVLELPPAATVQELAPEEPTPDSLPEIQPDKTGIDSTGSLSPISPLSANQTGLTDAEVDELTAMKHQHFQQEFNRILSEQLNYQKQIDKLLQSNPSSDKPGDATQATAVEKQRRSLKRKCNTAGTSLINMAVDSLRSRLLDDELYDPESKFSIDSVNSSRAYGERLRAIGSKARAATSRYRQELESTEQNNLSDARRAETQARLLKLEAFKIAVDCEIKRLLENFAKGSAVTAEQTYRIAPPDILLIDSIGLERSDPKIRDGDTLAIEVSGTPEDEPITGRFKVGPKGRLALGPRYGTVAVAGLDCDEAAVKIRERLERIIREPDVSLSLAESRPLQPISGEHLVGPDGRTSLGAYGTFSLNGLTVEEAQAAIEEHLKMKGFEATVSVSVFSYNSHVYYVAIERHGENTFVVRSPITGNDRVLDALSQVDGSLSAASKVQLYRPKPDGTEEVLDVDWQSIVQGKSQATNYKLKSGDRLFVKEAGAKGDGVKRY